MAPLFYIPIHQQFQTMDSIRNYRWGGAYFAALGAITRLKGKEIRLAGALCQGRAAESCA
jgi:hypothetical protein